MKLKNILVVYAKPTNKVEESTLKIVKNTLKRHKHIICNGKHIPIQTIRKDLGLKSTWFSVKEKDDKVVFEGRGYGHGVGLSQEGAYHMSKQGKSYQEITQFYYTNVRIISYKGINAFKDF